MRKRKVVRREIIFGNPGLETSGGCVYTYSTTITKDDDHVNGKVSDDKRDMQDNTSGYDVSTEEDERRKIGVSSGCKFDEGEEEKSFSHDDEYEDEDECEDEDLAYEYSRIVCICNVPPEQVPEGILNLARSHLSAITHVRMVISAEEIDSTTEAVTIDTKTEHSILVDGYEYFGIGKNNNNNKDGDDDDAALSRDINEFSSSSSQSSSIQCQRSYLVLISLSTPDSARFFVEDLHGKPYNSFETDSTASVFHVSRLELDNDVNDDDVSDDITRGLSLMYPFSDSAMDSAITNGVSSIRTEQQSETVTSGGRLKKISQDDETLSRSPNHHCSSTPARTIFEANNCPVCLEKMELRKRRLGQPPSSPSHKEKKQQKPKHKSGLKQRRQRQERATNNDSSRAPSQAHTQISPSSVSIPTTPTPSLTDSTTDAVSSIFTTACNHSFHMECLMQWQDSPCPVCRFDHSGLNETLSRCHICATTENIYVCLICGVASCWNNRNDISSSHAMHHYNETHHAYALDTQTQHVWDFAGRGYVHRLLQNVDDGKIVEANDPDDTTSHGMRPLVPPSIGGNGGNWWSSIEEEMEDGWDIVHRKLEGFADQYCTLLKNQLEHQRVHYGKILERMRKGEDVKGHGGIVGRRKKNHSTVNNHLMALKQERNQLQQRNATLRAKYEKKMDNITFLKNLNESLEANKEPMQNEIRAARNQINETKNMVKRCLPPLKEKVKILMLQIEKE